MYNFRYVRNFFFQAEDGIRDLVRSRGLGDVYKRQDELRCLWHRLDKDLIHFENSVRFDGRFPFTPFQILSGRVYMYPTLISSLDPSTAMVGEPRSAFFDEVLETWELTVRRIKDIYSERKDFTTIGLPIIRPKSHMRGL